MSMVPVVSTVTSTKIGSRMPRRHDRLLAAVDRGFGLQEVLAGLDEEGVGSAVDEALGLQGEGLLEVVVAGVAEARELGARPHRAQHPAHPAVCFFCRLGALAGDLARPLRRAPRSGRRCRSRRGWTSSRRRCWSRRRRCRPRSTRRGCRAMTSGRVTLRISLQPSSPRKSSSSDRSRALQHRAHRPVGDDDPVVHRIQQLLRTDGTGDGINIKRKTRHLNRLRRGPKHLRCVSVCYDGETARRRDRRRALPADGRRRRRGRRPLRARSSSCRTAAL